MELFTGLVYTNQCRICRARQLTLFSGLVMLSDIILQKLSLSGINDHICCYSSGSCLYLSEWLPKPWQGLHFLSSSSGCDSCAVVTHFLVRVVSGHAGNTGQISPDLPRDILVALKNHSRNQIQPLGEIKRNDGRACLMLGQFEYCMTKAGRVCMRFGDKNCGRRLMGDWANICGAA